MQDVLVMQLNDCQVMERARRAAKKFAVMGTEWYNTETERHCFGF